MSRVARRLLLALAFSAGIPAAPAAAAPPALGGLTPFPGATGCFTSSGAGGCTAYAPQAGGADVVQSGANVYAAGSDTLMAYRRAADGSLTPFDCVASAVLAPCATTEALLTSVVRLAVSAPTKTLYAATGSAAADSRVLAFRLDADGGIGARIGCLAEQATTNCTDVAALDTPRDIAVASDGRQLYSASQGTSGGLAAFAAGADGTFGTTPQLPGCIAPQGPAVLPCTTGDLKTAAAVAVRGTHLYAAWKGELQDNSGVEVRTLGVDGAIGARGSCAAHNVNAEASCATDIAGLTYPSRLLVAPDGRSLVVGADAPAVTTVALDTAGLLGALRACETATVVPTCSAHPGLAPISAVALSPDGRTLYAAAGNSGIWGFDRDATSAATSGGGFCVGPALPCAPVAAVGTATAVAVAPDGARVYGVGSGAGGLSVFQREVAPTCTPTSGTVAPPAAAVVLTLACSDPNGDPVTFEAATAPAHGTVAITSAGIATYTPAAAYSGTDGFSFRGNDGTVASSPTSVVIGIVAGQPVAPQPSPAVVKARSTIDRIASPVRAAALKRFTGRASGDLLKRVEIALVRLDHGARAAAKRRPACRRLLASGRLAAGRRVSGRCRITAFLTASGTARWTFNLLRRLPKGRYAIVSRATSASGTETVFSAAARNRRTFTVR